MAQHIDNCRNAALTYFCNYDLNNSNKTIEFRYQDELNGGINGPFLRQAKSTKWD